MLAAKQKRRSGGEEAESKKTIQNEVLKWYTNNYTTVAHTVSYIQMMETRFFCSSQKVYITHSVSRWWQLIKLSAS